MKNGIYLRHVSGHTLSGVIRFFFLFLAPCIINEIRVCVRPTLMTLAVAWINGLFISFFFTYTKGSKNILSCSTIFVRSVVTIDVPVMTCT